MVTCMRRVSARISGMASPARMTGSPLKVCMGWDGSLAEGKAVWLRLAEVVGFQVVELWTLAPSTVSCWGGWWVGWLWWVRCLCHLSGANPVVDLSNGHDLGCYG